jgi:kumamolisin
VQTSSGGYQLIDTTRPHTGAYSVYLGGYNNGTDTIYQQVAVPSTATSATLTYWWYMTSSEGTTTAYDKLTTQVLNSSGALLATLKTVSNTNTRGAWVKETFNLTAYKGQTIRVYFKGTTDSSLVTSFFVDDVSLNVC